MDAHAVRCAGRKVLRVSPREKREVKDGDVVECVGDEVCGHKGYSSKTVCNFFLILHPFNALIDVSNQFFQEAYFFGLVWKIVRMCLKFTLDQFTNRELPS